MSQRAHASTTYDEALEEERMLQGYALGQRVGGRFTGGAASLAGLLEQLRAESAAAAAEAASYPDDLHKRTQALLRLARWRDARYLLQGRLRVLAQGVRSRGREIYEIAALDRLAGGRG